MARTTTLSDDAFAMLRREKREGESDSDVVIRLVQALHWEKDPMKFLDTPIEFDMSREEHLEFIRKMRQADSVDGEKEE
ncbi:MAG: hypothetical protein HY556_11690 [Euryarchaeota archaeon]|nr:hypothetical protein [Euryarchaeota archaeon]